MKLIQVVFYHRWNSQNTNETTATMSRLKDFPSLISHYTNNYGNGFHCLFRPKKNWLIFPFNEKEFNRNKISILSHATFTNYKQNQSHIRSFHLFMPIWRNVLLLSESHSRTCFCLCFSLESTSLCFMLVTFRLWLAWGKHMLTQITNEFEYCFTFQSLSQTEFVHAIFFTLLPCKLSYRLSVCACVLLSTRGSKLHSHTDSSWRELAAVRVVDC